MPMPPSHCVNWRHMSNERGSSSGAATTLAPVVVKPDIASKYALIGLLSGSYAGEDVRQRAEAGRDDPRERDDEKAFADAHALLAARDELERPAHAGRDRAGREIRPEALRVADGDGDREERGEAEVLRERSDEIEGRRDIDAQPRWTWPKPGSWRSQRSLDLRGPCRLGEDDGAVTGLQHVVAVREERLAVADDGADQGPGHRAGRGSGALRAGSRGG